MISKYLAEIPIIGGQFFPDQDYSCLPSMVCAALVARERFKVDGPSWTPDLPLRWEHCKAMQVDDDHRHRLVEYFGQYAHRNRCWRCALRRFRCVPCSILFWIALTAPRKKEERAERQAHSPHRGLFNSAHAMRSPCSLIFGRSSKRQTVLAADEERQRRKISKQCENRRRVLKLLFLQY
jgi:hypothetical protein